MNRELQARLVAVLKDAMNAQGITQGDIARHIGTSSGMISQAFSCKGQMREERWRMCCEFCGVDFDHFAKSQQSRAEQSRAEQSRTEQSRAEQTEPVHDEKEVHHMPVVVKNTVSVELTEGQCIALKNFIEDEIFSVIRADSEIDSFAWLRDLMSAHAVLAKAVTGNVSSQ